MAQVVDLCFAGNGKSAAPHRRLLLLSRGLSLLFTLLMILSGLSVVAWFAVGVFYGDHVRVGSEGVQIYLHPHLRDIPGTVLFSSQPMITHLAGFADILLATAPAVFIFWHLRGLFRLYAAGIVFARQNAAHLKDVGLWLLFYPLIKFAANLIFRLAGGTDKAWLHMESVYALVLGLIVFVIAQVMEFGHEIEQEKDSFI